jgi:molybdopterin molybdotransferase
MAATVEQHAARVAELLQIELGTEAIPVTSALGRVTASAVLSPVDLPLFRNSQMDGFAVHAADVAAVPVELPIVGAIPASAASPAALAPGTAVRIMTGAVVPEGADAVIPVEDTTSTESTVSITRSRQRGEYVRDRGSDVLAGSVILPAAQLLAPRHLAVLAAAGLETVEVRRRLRVAVITTGAELVRPGEVPLPGQVFDANSVALVTAVAAAGGEVTLVRRVVDEPAALLAVLGEAAGAADVILTSGGISHGDYEVVRELLEPRGAWVGHVAMQPGGPQATATFEGVPVICFPGNPVSTQLSFEVFVAPIIREFAGLRPAARSHKALNDSVRSVEGKRQFLRGRVEGASVTPVSGPGSHLVAGMAAADCLIIIPEDVTAVALGETVEVWEL